MKIPINMFDLINDYSLESMTDWGAFRSFSWLLNFIWVSSQSYFLLTAINLLQFEKKYFNYELWSCIIVGWLLLYHMFSLNTRMTTWKWKTLKRYLIPIHLYAAKTSVIPYNFLFDKFCIVNFKKERKLANHFILLLLLVLLLLYFPFHSIQFNSKKRWNEKWLKSFMQIDSRISLYEARCVWARVSSRDVKNEWTSVCHDNLKQIAKYISVRVCSMWAASQKKHETNGPLLYVSTARSTRTIEAGTSECCTKITHTFAMW